MVNFDPLATEIDPVVWGTPPNFNGFRILAALLHDTRVVGVSILCGDEQRAPPIFGRATISWALAHISCFKHFNFKSYFITSSTYDRGIPVVSSRAILSNRTMSVRSLFMALYEVSQGVNLSIVLVVPARALSLRRSIEPALSIFWGRPFA